MSSLWDWLPPEIQEHILTFVIRETPLKPLHKRIKESRYEEDRDIATWPMPHSVEKIRVYEIGITIYKKKNWFGCTRYYRRIFNGKKSFRHYVDITQAVVPSFYIISSNNLDQITEIL